MFRKKIWQVVGLLTVLVFLLSACGGAQPTEEETLAEESQVEETITEEEPEAEVEETAAGEEEEEVVIDPPAELKIALVMTSTIDQPWYKTLVQAVDRVAKNKPHSVTITYDYTENNWGDDAERAMRAYAETGEYDIIFAASALSDVVANVMDDYPDILFAYTGSGNTALGGNAYWTYHHLHEAGYLLGLMAGSLTETDVVGIVSAYPFEEPNDVLNGFIIGAKEANPDVKVKVTFIAKEATYALIAAGADYVFAERFGPFEALAEKGKYGFGQYEDQWYLSPDVVVSSTVMIWDPIIEYLIDEWWAHETAGKEYDAPMEEVWFSVAEGGSDIAPFYSFVDTIPQEVQNLIAEKHDAILNGEFVVPLIIDPPVSD